MGFPTLACIEPASDEAKKQSLRLVNEVSLSMSWNIESFPVGREKRKGVNNLMLFCCCLYSENTFKKHTYNDLNTPLL